MKLMCALVVHIIALVAVAALVPLMTLAQEPEPADVWSGTAEVSFVSTSGNTDTRTLGVGGEIVYRPTDWSGLAKIAFIESEADDVVNARSFSALLQVSRGLSPRLEAYGRVGYLKDTFAGIDDRISSDGGISYAIVPTGQHSLTTLIGFGFTREVRVGADDLSLVTANATLRYSWALSETSALTNETAATAAMRNAGDWRFTNDVGLTAGLNGIFSLRFSQTLTYLNEPVPGFRQADVVVKAALAASF